MRHCSIRFSALLFKYQKNILGKNLQWNMEKNFAGGKNPQSLSQFESNFYLGNESESAPLENRQVHYPPLWWKGSEDLTHFHLHFLLGSLSSKPKSCLGHPAVCGSPGLIPCPFFLPILGDICCLWIIVGILVFYDYVCMYMPIICQFWESNLTESFSFQEFPLTYMFPFDLHGIP